MSLFVLDTAGDEKLHEKQSLSTQALTKHTKRKLLNESAGKNILTALKTYEDSKSDDDDEYFGLPPPSVDITSIIEKTLAKTATEKDRKIKALEEVNLSISAALENAQSKSFKQRKRIIDLDHSDFNVETGKFFDEKLFGTNVPEEVSQSKLKSGFEQLKALPSLSSHKTRKLNRIECAKTKGGEWYNIPATEITEEVKNELKILQMRSALDPKHFYKKNDLKVLPKYFQIGTVLPSPLDHYSERDVRKNKKHTLVEELLADTEFQSYNKRKYNEIMARKNKYAQRKAMKKMKKLKKNK